MRDDVHAVAARARARRRAGAAHGRRRQGAHPHRRQDHPRARARALQAAMRGGHPQRQRRSRALRRHRPAGGARHGAGFRRPARRHPRRARLGGGTRARRSPTSRACRAIVRSCRATWSRALARGAQARRHAARLRRSGEWRHPVVGLWPVALREDLRKALVEEDLHKIETWTARHGIAVARLASDTRSIPSSTSTRPRTSPRRGHRGANATFERLIAVAADS